MLFVSVRICLFIYFHELSLYLCLHFVPGIPAHPILAVEKGLTIEKDTDWDKKYFN